MDASSEIVKVKVLPYLEKDMLFDSNKTTPEFWNNFALLLAQYETDTKPLYIAVYSLKLENAEPLITILAKLYNQFVKELAENYVLGYTTEATDYLLSVQNSTFLKEVAFFEILQQAIKKVERNRIKKDLPELSNRLSFELTDEAISMAAKKKGREDLKAKMKEWDKMETVKEVKETDTVLPKAASLPFLVLFNKKIVLSKLQLVQWIKYTLLTATVGVTGTIVYKAKFEKQETKPNPVEVTTPTKTKITDTLFVKTNDSIIEEEAQLIIIDSSQIEKGEESKVKKTEHSGINVQQNYNVTFVGLRRKIAGFQKYKSLDNEKEHQEEYEKLLNKLNKYIFIEKSLTIYKEKQSDIAYILPDGKGNIYFYDGQDFYKIIKTQTPLEFKAIEDPDLLEKLDVLLNNDN